VVWVIGWETVAILNAGKPTTSHTATVVAMTGGRKVLTEETG